MAGEEVGIGALLSLGAGVLALIIILGLIILGLAIFLFVFWILMIIDCATRKFKNPDNVRKKTKTNDRSFNINFFLHKETIAKAVKKLTIIIQRLKNLWLSNIS